ncbi:ADP-ribosylglycohydrolase [Desulfosarcina ovata subsp. sediminis]|uniref:ADP-ribosylglycohydrolase n=1 Tax=Desulfosarcina ovata subsp. sediminis TaxID=885957 RepID=A0A5K7ZVW2_9BACT|nr:ADP-ribosylglycohydrolase family protein [Desulfosarcina ovata]BBO84393.1 ADP-ribosylglycohydrolase [Desulfosarcina ovata subsp. sediminis]
MTDNQQAAVFGAFVADALSLGVHWVYNTGVIDKKFGRVERYYDPLTSYHKGKKAGDFTHYGDQMLVLLESVSETGRFEALHFARTWRHFFEDYTGYFDKATKATLEKMNAGEDLTGCGSDSDDLAGASRLAALLPAYPDDREQFVDAARAQTAITHTNPLVIASADFFARTLAAVLNGKPPVAALEETLAARFADSPIARQIAMGLESRERDTRETIAEFGQMCSVDAGLPGAVHLIARYADDFKTAMVENVMAGGDSSARGSLAGMVLGAAHGMAAIPEAWISEMAAGQRIKTLLTP